MAAWLGRRRREAAAGTLAPAIRDGLACLPHWQEPPVTFLIAPKRARIGVAGLSVPAWFLPPVDRMIRGVLSPGSDRRQRIADGDKTSRRLYRGRPDRNVDAELWSRRTDRHCLVGFHDRR
jgi:hypothetical protein